MGDVVNLRQARKRAAKSEHEAKAADNRVAFGTPKADKRIARIEAQRQSVRLDGARLEGSRLKGMGLSNELAGRDDAKVGATGDVDLKSDTPPLDPALT